MLNIKKMKKKYILVTENLCYGAQIKSPMKKKQVLKK